MSERIVSASASVPASPGVIFDIIADPRQHTLIDGSGTVRDTVSGPDRLGPGARFTVRRQQGAPYRITSRVRRNRRGTERTQVRPSELSRGAAQGGTGA